MELLIGRKRKALLNEGIIRGMEGVISRVRHLDISDRDRDTVIRAIRADIAKIEALEKPQR